MHTTTPSLEAGDYIEAGGHRTHYHEAGKGETILFVHGSGPGVTAWANWRNALPLFSEKFHVLAPDLVGFGYSARPAGAQYGKDMWVDALIAFLKAKNVEKCHIVGNSLGGALALALAAREPQMIERIVLMGAAGTSYPVSKGLEAVWGYTPSFQNMHELIADHFAYDPALATKDLVQMRYEASMQEGFQESYSTMFPPPYQRHVEALVTPDEEIRKITSPTLLLHGREDKVVPLSASLKMESLLPNADMHIFGKCGHWTMIEKKDDFNRLVMDFFLAHSAVKA